MLAEGRSFLLAQSADHGANHLVFHPSRKVKEALWMAGILQNPLPSTDSGSLLSFLTRAILSFSLFDSSPPSPYAQYHLATPLSYRGKRPCTSNQPITRCLPRHLRQISHWLISSSDEERLCSVNLDSGGLKKPQPQTSTDARKPDPKSPPGLQP